VEEGGWKEDGRRMEGGWKEDGRRMEGETVGEAEETTETTETTTSIKVRTTFVNIPTPTLRSSTFLYLCGCRSLPSSLWHCRGSNAGAGWWSVRGGCRREGVPSSTGVERAPNLENEKIFQKYFYQS
jgi:hypothetical protein